MENNNTMSDKKCYQDNQEQGVTLSKPVESEGDADGLNDDADNRSSSCRQGPEAPQTEPMCGTRNTEEQAKINYAQTESAVTETSSKSDAMDKTFRSWSTNGLPDVSPPSKTATSLPSMPQSDRSAHNSWPSPPRKPDCAPEKKRFWASEASQGRARTNTASQRTRLLVFIKIILKCLDYQDPSLHLEAKQIITECTRKNREGIPGYDPLANAITSQLRIAVGEVHWNRAESLMSHYLKSRSGNNTLGNAVKIDKPRYAAV